MNPIANLIDVGHPHELDITWGEEKDSNGHPKSATVVLHYEARGLADAKATVLNPVRRLVEATAPSPIHFQAPEPFPVEALL